MPALSDHPSNSSVKLLIASDSGTGKTGGLASLIDAGKKVFILDFDRGVSTIRGFVKDKSKLASSVRYITFEDKFKLTGKTLGIAKANTFRDAMEVLEKGSPEWGGENPGGIGDWPSDYVLVIDTLSTLSKSALYHVMQLDGKGMSHPEIQHYGVAMDNIEKFLGMITSESVKCNVIVNTHLSPDEKSGRIYPEAVGSKLNPKIARYFDNMITIQRKAGTLQYNTRKDGIFNCKTAVKLDENYPLETGLVKILDALNKG